MEPSPHQGKSGVPFEVRILITLNLLLFFLNQTISIGFIQTITTLNCFTLHFTETLKTLIKLVTTYMPRKLGIKSLCLWLWASLSQIFETLTALLCQVKFGRCVDSCSFIMNSLS